MQAHRLSFMAFLFLAISISKLHGQDASVLNVQFTQRPDGWVEVTYDLAGDSSEKYTIKLSVAQSGSRTKLAMRRASLSGDIGEDISPGWGKKIIWNLPQDYPKGLAGDGFVFVVEAIEKGGGSKLRWVLAGLGAAAGAALLLWPDTPPPVTTGSLVIDVPNN